MRSVDPTWSLAVLVCHNTREPGATRPSCGEAAGTELRAWVRDRARAEGFRGQVLCTRSGCLDVCSGEGTTVALMAADGRPREVLVVGTDDREALWARISASLAPAPTRSTGDDPIG